MYACIFLLHMMAACYRVQRASFLAYAIANGWGTKAGGIHSQQTLDRIVEKWRIGEGRCAEVMLSPPLLNAR